MVDEHREAPRRQIERRDSERRTGPQRRKEQIDIQSENQSEATGPRNVLDHPRRQKRLDLSKKRNVIFPFGRDEAIAQRCREGA